MIFYCVLTSAINALASLVLALIVYVKNQREPANIAFSQFAFAATVWSGFYFMWQTSEQAEVALHYTRLLTAAAIVIPVTYFHFATRLLGLTKKWELRIGVVLVAAFVTISLSTPWLVVGVEPRAMFSYWPIPGWLYPFYLLTFFFYFSITLWLLAAGYRKADGLRRNQLRLVALGTAIGFGGGATNFLLWYYIPIPPVGNGLVAVYVLMVGYAMIRFRLMDFDLLIARGVAYSTLSASLALLTPAVLFGLETLALLPPIVAGFGILYLASFITTSVTIWALPELRRRIDSFLEQRILGDRLADRKMLRMLAAHISSAPNEAELFERVVSGTSEALDVGMVAIYTRTEFESDFHRRAASLKERPSMDGFPEMSLLAQTLKEGQRGVLLDEVVHESSGGMQTYFAELRQRQGIELAVPIIGDTFFYGFAVLGPRGGRALFNEIDISLLEAIGLQIGLSLRARQLERRASQSQKLIALGTLAAGLAHEIRNPLTSIQTFSALLREETPDPEALRE
ncbi:MAG: histidine kinase N-terminal 7TM domain-containing protein, partial [Desulfobulbaceae bacterium]|nr:histidine kinase N-terminal 7TM domain-containing protein [Desulfobulbaceae bacterium]